MENERKKNIFKNFALKTAFRSEKGILFMFHKTPWRFDEVVHKEKNPPSTTDWILNIDAVDDNGM